MALVQTQDGLLEGLLHPGLLKVASELLEEQRRTTSELRALVDRMQTLGSALAAAVAARAVDEGRPGLPAPSLPLPLSPKTINEQMLSVQLGGYLDVGVTSSAFLAPAGETTTLVLPVVPGYVTMFGGPFYYAASYYSTGIEFRASIDGRVITGGGWPVVLVSSGSFTLGQYAHAWNRVELTVTNRTTIDATIFAVAETIYIDRNFFQRFYLPLLQHGYDILKTLAMLVNGGQPIP